MNLKALFRPSLVASLALLVSNHLVAASCHQLTVSGSDGWQPIAYQDEGEARGIAYDVIRMAAAQLNLPVEFELDLGWSKAMDKLKSGSIDMVAGVYWTSERVHNFYISHSVSQEELYLYVRKDRTFTFNKLTDLFGMRTDIVKNSSYGKNFDSFARAYLDENNLNQVKSFDKVMERLNKGKIDYVILDPFAAKSLIKKAKLEGKIVALPNPLSANPVHLLMSKESPCGKYITDINMIITNLKINGKLKQLQDKYNAME